MATRSPAEANAVAYDERAIRKLQPRSGRPVDTYWVEGHPGLAIRVGARGAVYYAVYRANRRVRWFRIGKATSVSPAQAWVLAGKAMSSADIGADPQEKRQAEKAEKRHAGTFAALALAYVGDREQRGKVGSKTAREYRRMVAADIAGTTIGRKLPKEVTAADLDYLLSTVRKRGATMSNRLFQLLRAVCRWGHRKGRLAVNPMAAVDRPAVERPRERVLSDPELRCLLVAADEQPEPVRAAVWLLALLGQRSEETLLMRRADVDLETTVPTWTIPGSFRKGDRLHVVPLSPTAVRMIRRVWSLSEGLERILDGVAVENEERDWWGAVRDRTIELAKAGDMTMERFVKHDLRRTAMTGMTKLGTSRFIAQRVIGHKEPGVGSVYDRNDYVREKLTALTKWGRHVDGIVTGKRSADVVPLARA